MNPIIADALNLMRRQNGVNRQLQEQNQAQNQEILQLREDLNAANNQLENHQNDLNLLRQEMDAINPVEPERTQREREQALRQEVKNEKSFVKNIEIFNDISIIF